MEKSVNMTKDDNIFRALNNNLTEEDMLMLSPLQLAYIGDAVFELCIRTYLMDKDISVNDLHKSTTKFVKAKSQSEIYHGIKDTLTEKEESIVKRGRNAKSHTSPKNADLIDYKYSTGFEALLGYLYLTKQDDRILQIINQAINLKNT